MRLFSRSTAIPAVVGGFVLITAVAACTLFGGSGSPGARTGSGTSSGASAGSSASGGDGLTWLPSGGVAAASPDGTAGEGPGGTAGQGPDGTDAATLAPGQTRRPQSTVAPRSSATAGATQGPGATAAPTATILPASPTPKPPTGGPCYVFPSSNVWNQRVDGLSVASNSAAMVGAIGAGDYLHPDFDAIGDGIPYNIVDTSTPTYNVSFQYADESDPGPYPIPANPRIEGGSDRHLLLLDLGQCKLWELYAASKSGSTWSAGSGAIFDLRSNALRPAGWTSADAAGLPIFPGLVRYAEVLTGSIEHAIRFTAPDTCGYIYPARHLTADACSNLPPMGLRLRLKASVNISSFGPNAQIVLTALKRYGMILADNGSPWYISGVPDSRWNDDEFHVLQTLHGTDFEVVNTSGLRNG